MTGHFQNQTVLVTGAGAGIGREIARAFAAEGADVAVAGRTEAALAETVALIEAAGGRARAVVADVTRGADVTAMVGAAAAGGRLDVAVNNAGVLGPVGPAADLDEASWRDVVDVNLTGVWLAMKHEIARMRAQEGGGAIVNVASSIGAHVRVPGLAAYAATKAGVAALTRAAARDHAGDGVRVNAVSPGPIDTPMSLGPGETDADRAARLRTAVPAGRVGLRREVAAAVLWLASPEAAYAVGHDLVLDGGASA